MATLLEEETYTYWHASLTVHGIEARRGVSQRTARRALALLARRCATDRLRCAAGGTLISHTSGALPGRGAPPASGELPCDVEPA